MTTKESYYIFKNGVSFGTAFDATSPADAVVRVLVQNGIADVETNHTDDGFICATEPMEALIGPLSSWTVIPISDVVAFATGDLRDIGVARKTIPCDRFASFVRDDAEPLWAIVIVDEQTDPVVLNAIRIS